MHKNKAKNNLEARFLTVEDIARDLSVAEDTVRGWIRGKNFLPIGSEKNIALRLSITNASCNSAEQLMAISSRKINHEIFCELRKRNAL